MAHKKYTDYMCDKYDSEFKEAEAGGLKWYPWIGKHYHKTKIFVVGMSTDKRDGPDWTKELEDSRNASRTLAAWDNNDGELFRFDHNGSSFKKMAHIFTDYAELERDVDTYTSFWSAVAFNNFFQVIVENMGDIPERLEIQKAKQVFYKTLDIIQPKLVLTWENDLSWFWLGHRPGIQGIGRITPFVAEQKRLSYCPPIVGIVGTLRALINAHVLSFYSQMMPAKDQ